MTYGRTYLGYSYIGYVQILLNKIKVFGCDFQTGVPY